ncbi:MAG: Na+/H+ antiporter subunit E [Kiloniellales bacterium]|nr:Na+/H+ antiporter subunit E [Kiloniellales bacterium]
MAEVRVAGAGREIAAVIKRNRGMLAKMSHALGLGFALATLWVLLSGIFQPLIVAFGIVSCLLVVVICRRMDVVDHESIPLHLQLRIFGYWGWLGREIVKSNIHVARLIIDPKLPISPRLIRVKATQRTDVGRVIHANSITLTPGTVSIELENDEILVHAISSEAAEGTLEGGIDRRVTAVEVR